MSTKRPKTKTWRILVDITREVTVQARTEAEARDLGGRRLAFYAGANERVTSTHVGWLDEWGTSHRASCAGRHCRHYDCDPADSTYCTQCDPECQ
jgi:hypothetical protein